MSLNILVFRKLPIENKPGQIVGRSNTIIFKKLSWSVFCYNWSYLHYVLIHFTNAFVWVTLNIIFWQIHREVIFIEYFEIEIHFSDVTLLLGQLIIFKKCVSGFFKVGWKVWKLPSDNTVTVTTPLYNIINIYDSWQETLLKKYIKKRV